jgi:hypothetical protein
MLVVAGMVMRARRLLGWRRIPAFVCGLALPVTVALQQWVAPAAANVAFPLLTTLGFALLGVVVRSAADGAPAPR